MGALSEKLQGVDRKVLAGVGLIALVIVFAGIWFFASSGGEEEAAEEAFNPVQYDEFGNVVSVEGFVDQFEVGNMVEATIAAMEPTPTLTPTPDIAATLVADMALQRPGRAVVVNPLSDEGLRNPFLTPADMEMLEGVGRKVWHFTKVWLRLTNFLGLEVRFWTVEGLKRETGWATGMFGSAPDVPRPDLREVNPVVVAYSESLQDGFLAVEESVRQLEAALKFLDEADEVGHVERLMLSQFAEEASRALRGFDDAVGSYGCSICGELVRTANR